MPQVLKKFNISQFFLFLLASSREAEPLEEAKCIPVSGLKGSPHGKQLGWAKNGKSTLCAEGVFHVATMFFKTVVCAL